MAVFFLELDDEITSAVGRLRGVSDPSVALVLPAGSRIASSRINFRLLAREATARGARLAVVSPEAPARALAIAAGLPAYGTVREYESAMAGGEGATAGGPEAPIAAPAPAGGPPDETVAADTLSAAAVSTAGAAGAAAGESARAPELPVAHAPRRLTLPRPRGRAAIVAILVLVVLGGGSAAGAYFVLPEARITLVPRVETFGPLTVQVTADTNVSEVDPGAGTVPAAWVDVPVDAQGTFKATGVKVTETKATGSVTFSNLDPTPDGAQSIPAGSIVKTQSGIAFRTESDIVVAKAKLQGLRIIPSSKSVDVEAVKAGTTGNVAAGTITVIPPGYSSEFLKVTNPRATSGGTHVETKVVKQSDYDAAVNELTDQLLKTFQGKLASGNVASEGALVVPESGTLDPATFAPAAAELVGKEMESFDLSAQATGHVVTVATADFDSIGAERLRASKVPPGYVLFDQTVNVEYRQLTSSDPSKPLFEVTAQGQGYRQIDPAEVKAQVLGRSVEEARTILARYGDPTIALTPDWFGTIPRFDWRVTVEVRPPGAAS